MIINENKSEWNIANRKLIALIINTDPKNSNKKKIRRKNYDIQQK